MRALHLITCGCDIREGQGARRPAGGGEGGYIVGRLKRGGDYGLFHPSCEVFFCALP